MNLLMCAPLHDNRGTVKYYIGAQVDVSGLINDGRGIESFERLLSKDRLDARYQDVQRNSSHTMTSSRKSPTKALTELGEMLSLEESNSVQLHSRNNSMRDDVSLGGSQAGGGFGRNRRDIGSRQGRRVIGDEDRYGDDERSAWALSSSYPSGKLPGLYQNVSSLLVLLHNSVLLDVDDSTVRKKKTQRSVPYDFKSSPLNSKTSTSQRQSNEQVPYSTNLHSHYP